MLLVDRELTLLSIPKAEGDAKQFLGRVTALLRGVASAHQPLPIQVHRIDNWFGSKWLGFRGKAMGALGVGNTESNTQFTVPPFVPNRVVWQARFRFDKASSRYVEDGPGIKLHRKQQSGNNLTRYVSRIAPDTVLLWFSGNSQNNGQGSVMAYYVSKDSCRGWYAGLDAALSWRPASVVGITSEQLESLAKTGAA